MSLALFFNTFVFVYLAAKKGASGLKYAFRSSVENLSASSGTKSNTNWMKNAAHALLCTALLFKHGKQTVTFSKKQKKKKTAYRNPCARVLAPATEIVATDTASIQMNAVNFAKHAIFKHISFHFLCQFSAQGGEKKKVN